MIIKKIHIISFGGLKNYTLELSEGLNCIYGDNEQGKTTVMSFIKMMFYGNERGSSQISKNIRKKYTPWDGSQMSGSIEFEMDGKGYKLEREFRSSNSTDKVSITDLSLGEKQTAQGDIGVRLFGMSAAAFERSIFIGQLGYPDGDTGAESELNARLSNIVSTGDEKVSLEEVTSRIEKSRYALISKSDKAGEYYKNSLIAKELNDKLTASIIADRQYIEGKEKLISHIKETEELLKKAELLKVQLAREQDVKNAQKLKELLKTKETLEKVKSELILTDGTPADENTLRNLKFSVAKLENASRLVAAKEKETEIVKNQLDTLLNGPKLQADETPEKLAEDISLLESNLGSLTLKSDETKARIEELKTKQKQKAKFNPLLLCIGIVLVITAALILSVSPIVSLALGVTGIALGVLSFVLKPNKKQKLLFEELHSLESILSNQIAHGEDLKIQITQKNAKAEAIRLASTSNAQVIEAQRSQLLIFQKELLDLKNEEELLKAESEKVLRLLNKNGDDIPKVIEALEKSAEKQKELKQHINFLLRDLNNISYEEAKIKLSQIEDTHSDVDFEKIKADYEKLSEEITQRKSKEAAVLVELKALMNGLESPDVLRIKLNEINELLNSQKAFCDSADIALEVLKESFAELRQSYGSELEKKSAEIFSLLTKGKYSNMTISKSFGINVEEAQNPISREAEYLSSGTYDQAYLSVRLAVAKLLSGDLPLFLDDTLTQYDDNRANTTLQFLRDYSKDSQSIMFTCHKTIWDFAKKLNCKTEKL